MPEWLLDAFLKGGPYALSVPLVATVIVLWREVTRLRDLLPATLERHATETAARQERHATEVARLHEKSSAALAELHTRHDAALEGVTEARIEEMGRVTTAVVALASTAQVLDRMAERTTAPPLPLPERQPSRPRLPRGGGEG